MEESCEFMKFNSKQELTDFLKNYFKEISDVDEFIILAHQINDFRDEFSTYEPLEKLASILYSGLSASKYASIDGTTIRMGSSLEGKTADAAVDYDYHVYHKNRIYPTLLLALPRFVEVNGEKTEYVMSKYVRKDRKVTNLKQLYYEKTGDDCVVLDNQHAVKCWADVLKGFSSFKTGDTLCAFYETDDGCYNLILPHTHWVERGTEEYKNYKNSLSRKIESYHMSLEDAIMYKNKKNQNYIDDLTNSID